MGEEGWERRDGRRKDGRGGMEGERMDKGEVEGKEGEEEMEVGIKGVWHPPSHLAGIRDTD